MPDPNSIEERRRIKCEVCGVSWEEHTADCPRHDYRPHEVPAWVAAAAQAIEKETGRRVKSDATR